MNDLPELPFQKVLSYLSLEEVIKSRAISRRWYMMIDSFRVKSLCFSEHPSGFILGRLTTGAFVRNFVSSPRFASFFNPFGQTILSNLKHLRLCELHLDEENRAALAPTIQSFGQLEELDIIRFGYPPIEFKPKMKFELSLPMLQSIQLQKVDGNVKLTLDAPRLRKVKLWECSSDLRLHLVHAESVERLLIDQLKHIAVKTLKNLENLQSLYSQDYSRINSTLLSSLKQLKEIHMLHLYSRESISKVFEQKQRSGRTELKIYLHGLLLNGPDDPAIPSFSDIPDKERFRNLAENPSRLADEIPFHSFLFYSAIECVVPGSEMYTVNRFTDLNQIILDGPVPDIERFLGLLKSLDLAELSFSGDQPQDMFDRLPEHCAVQSLSILKAPSDFRFLFRLKRLIRLYLNSIDTETVRKVCEELQFLSLFYFKYKNKGFRIQTGHLKQFEVSIGDRKGVKVADLNAAIQLIIENAPRRKRKAKELE